MQPPDPKPPDDAPRPGRPRPSWQDRLHGLCEFPLVGDFVAASVLGLAPNLLVLPIRGHLEEGMLLILLGLLVVPSDFTLRSVGLRLRPLGLPGWVVGLLLVLLGFVEGRG